MNEAQNEEYKKRVGRNILNLLIDRDMEQQELAKMLDVSTSSVSSWIHGKRLPRMDKVNKMCQIFGVKRSAILEDGNPTVIEMSNNATRLPMPNDWREDFIRKIKEILAKNDIENEVLNIVSECLRKNPEYEKLFRAAAKIHESDIDFAVQILERCKKEG